MHISCIYSGIFKNILSEILSDTYSDIPAILHSIWPLVFGAVPAWTVESMSKFATANVTTYHASVCVLCLLSFVRSKKMLVSTYFTLVLTVKRYFIRIARRYVRKYVRRYASTNVRICDRIDGRAIFFGIIFVWFFCFPAWLCGFCWCVAFVVLPCFAYLSIYLSIYLPAYLPTYLYIYCYIHTHPLYPYMYLNPTLNRL